LSGGAQAARRVDFRLLAISAGDAHLGACERRRLLSWLESLSRHLPAAAVQLREKGLDDRPAHELFVEARAIFPGTLLINGRADLALAGGADGVHLTGSGPPAERIVARFGRDLLVGRSVHSSAEATTQARSLDYLCLSPVFATPGKPRAIPVGLEQLTVAARSGAPVFALGGIDDAPRARAAIDAGAFGIAGIRLFQDPRRASVRLAELEAFGLSVRLSG